MTGVQTCALPISGFVILTPSFLSYLSKKLAQRTVRGRLYNVVPPRLSSVTTHLTLQRRSTLRGASPETYVFVSRQTSAQSHLVIAGLQHRQLSINHL